MNCESCKDVAENGKAKVEESFAMKLLKETQKTSKRWFVAWIITFIAFLALISGIIYFVMTSEIEVKTVEVTQAGEGINTYTGHDGDVNYEPKN